MNPHAPLHDRDGLTARGVRPESASARRSAKQDDVATPGLLRLQRSAGNAAVAELLGGRAAPTRRSGSAGFMGGHVVHRLVADVQRTAADSVPVQRDKVKHTTGKQVDTYLNTSPFFKALVASAVKGGTKAEGAVKIHDPASFQKAWIAYAKVRSNPDTGKLFTEGEAKAWEPTVNAFQGDDKIHIHEERGEAGTAIHESMHLFANASFVSTYGFNVNEGTTEVFTRKLCAEQSVARGVFYASQRASVDKLQAKAGEATLANAYYGGSLGALKTAADKATKAGTFDTWLGHMKKGKYSDADALF